MELHVADSHTATQLVKVYIKIIFMFQTSKSQVSALTHASHPSNHSMCTFWHLKPILKGGNPKQF